MALTEIKTSGIADDAVTTDKLANAINTERTANTAKTTNATHTGEVTGSTGLTIEDNVVDEANLKVSNSPTNGYFLSAQSGNTGGLTWAAASGTTINNNAANRVITGSGTANTLNGESDFIVDSSNNIGIGNDASFPVYTHVSSRNFMLGTGSESTALQIHSSNSTYGGIYFGDVADRTDANSYIGSIEYKHGDDDMRFRTNGSERMRIDSSGKVGIGTTAPDAKLMVSDSSYPDIGLKYSGTSGGHASRLMFMDKNGVINAQVANNLINDNAGQAAAHLDFSTSTGGTLSTRMRIKNNGYVGIGNTDPQRHLEIMDWSASGSSVGLELGEVGIRSSKTGSSTVSHLRFYNANGQVGSIDTASSQTNYQTSSDYRLKENVVSISDGITRVKQLKPSKFNWILDHTNTPVDGFLAHEVSSIVPEAITGTKDAVAEQKDVDDAIAEAVGDPIYQSIDHSKLVPLLTAALQEAVAKIETLETKVQEAVAKIETLETKVAALEAG